MRFIHTADWQIGMKAAHVGSIGNKVREVRLESAHRIIQEATNHNVEFIILAGDTFEDNGVDRVLVQKVADLLSAFDGSVYVIPGNHDPLVPGSVWDHPAWPEQGQIRVLREPKPLEVFGGVIYPCPAREKHSRKDPTAWIDARSGQGIRIGLAHGTVEGIIQDEPEYPIARDAANRAGLDYLALGHWHSTATYLDTLGAIRMAYSGTHETTKFRERDSGNALLVEIHEAGAAPKVTPLKTGHLEWVTLEEEFRQEGDMNRVRRLVESIENPSTTLIELTLSGLLSGSDRAELARLKEIIASRFLFVRIDTSGLRPLPEDERWLDELPPGVVREAAHRLLELTAPGFSGARPAGATPQVAAQALLELYALTQEVGL